MNGRWHKMATVPVIESFQDNLVKILDSVVESRIYTDFVAMYEDGRIQKEQFDKILIAFHEKSLAMAGSTAENIALKSYRLDEIVTKDVEVKEAQIGVENARKDLIVRQKEGFDDNVVIERVKTTSEAIGMIQSGGNEAPQTFFDEWADAINDIKEVAKTHPNVT